MAGFPLKTGSSDAKVPCWKQRDHADVNSTSPLSRAAKHDLLIESSSSNVYIEARLLHKALPLSLSSVCLPRVP
jgi:hypothetical protein